MSAAAVLAAPMVGGEGGSGLRLGLDLPLSEPPNVQSAGVRAGDRDGELAAAAGKCLEIPPPLLFSGVLVFATLGVYSLSASIIDVLVMYAIGVMGFFMRRYGFPIAPVILGVILDPVMEIQLRRALVASGGEWGCSFRASADRRPARRRRAGDRAPVPAAAPCSRPGAPEARDRPVDVRRPSSSSSRAATSRPTATIQPAATSSSVGHNWPDCTIEVLELRTVLDELGE